MWGLAVLGTPSLVSGSGTEVCSGGGWGRGGPGLPQEPGSQDSCPRTSPPLPG